MESNALNATRKKVLRVQTRETIANVYDFLKQDAGQIMRIVTDPLNTDALLISELNTYLNRVRKRTALACGTSEKSVTNILRERREGAFKCPFKNRKKRPEKLELTDSNKDFIQSTIQNYQAEHNELPSLIQLKKIFQDKLNYTGSASTLRRVLMKMGYKWGKPANKKWGHLIDVPYEDNQADKVPNSNSKKLEMRQWLSARNITFDPNMSKNELYELVKTNKDKNVLYNFEVSEATGDKDETNLYSTDNRDGANVGSGGSQEDSLSNFLVERFHVTE